MSGQYNLRNPAVKRLMKEAQELRESTEQYSAQPLEDNLFEWHFTIRGPIDSEFDSGIYHGRITLPPEYPMKPPSIMLLTPNGRFETFKKICLSISGHHPESWQPSWSIRTALLAIIGFMPTHGNGAIGSLDYTAEERKVLAKRSLEWKCSECGSMKTILKPVTEASKKTTEEAKELASQINFQGENEKHAAKKESSDTVAAETVAGAEPSTQDAPSTAVSAAGATPTIPHNFPGGMPNATMPLFMAQRMMTPPNTLPGGPMTPFARPLWPSMPSGGAMPGVTTGSAMPPRAPGMMYSWPPMFNPMVMNAQMAAMMNQRAQTPGLTTHRAATPTPAAPTPTASTPAATISPITVTSAQTSASVSSPSPAVTASSSSPSSASLTAITTQMSSSSSTLQSASPTTPMTTSPTDSTTAMTPSTTTISSTPTSSGAAAAAGTAAATTDLRQRTAAAAPPRGVAATYGTAELPTVRRGENPAVVLVMALLGLLIIALILRRLYNVVNAGTFDNDF